jgi:hypothetical protein
MGRKIREKRTRKGREIREKGGGREAEREEGMREKDEKYTGFTTAISSVCSKFF